MYVSPSPVSTLVRPFSTTVLSGSISVKSLSIHVLERRIRSLYPPFLHNLEQ